MLLSKSRAKVRFLLKKKLVEIDFSCQRKFCGYSKVTGLHKGLKPNYIWAFQYPGTLFRSHKGRNLIRMEGLVAFSKVATAGTAGARL